MYPTTAAAPVPSPKHKNIFLGIYISAKLLLWLVWCKCFASFAKDFHTFPALTSLWVFGWSWLNGLSTEVKLAADILQSTLIIACLLNGSIFNSMSEFSMTQAFTCINHQETHYQRPHIHRMLTAFFHKDIYNYLKNTDQLITSETKLLYTLKSTIQWSKCPLKIICTSNYTR